MKIHGTERGIEARPYSDTVTDSTHMQLTANPDFESQHTYYDICPWSHDGRYILFSSAPLTAGWSPFGHNTLACPEGRINILDTDNMEIHEVARDAIYMKHGGAFCMWHPTRHRIYYRKDRDHSACLDLETGEETTLPVRIRELSPDGELFAFAMQTPHDGNQGAAIGVMPENGGPCRELVNRDQLHAITPNRAEFSPEDMLLGNTKWHPDSRLLLIAMWVYPHPESRRSLYVVSRDGSEVRWLGHFGGHHSWTPDGRQVLFVDWRDDEARAAGQGRFLHTVNVDGSNRTCIFDQPAGSHPLMHPDGKTVLDFDRQGVYVAHTADRRVEYLTRFQKAFVTDHHGTHAHPTWNQAGDEILYNSAESGHSEIYRLAFRVREGIGING